MVYRPFGRLSLFLHLREDALGLVVLAVRTGGHFPLESHVRELAGLERRGGDCSYVALDLLLPAHVTGLAYVRKTMSSEAQPEEGGILLQFSSASHRRNCRHLWGLGAGRRRRRAQRSSLGVWESRLRCSFRRSGAAG